jgi:hypothetical protein
MTYNEYIELGFTRLDINDPIELKNLGYGGFVLEYNLNRNMLIEAHFTELYNPKLYIKRPGTETYTIIPITGEIVKDLIKYRK